MQPLVSVIVPVYGVEAYIARCARSLFAQTYPAVEFIFVDDGSPDRSVAVLKEVLAEYPDVAPRVQILSKPNEGQSLARKTGLEAAKGEYVLMVDSDDWLETSAIEKLVGKAQETQADVVVFDFWKEYARRSKLDSEKASSIADTDLFRKRLYTYGAYGYVWNKFWRKSVCEGLYYPRYSMHEDIVFCTQALYRAKTVVQLKEGLYHYDRTNRGSATRVKKAVRRSRSARNMMDFYYTFAGQAASPITGLEDELILRAAWIGLTRDKTLFADYPELASLALAYPVKGGRFVSIPAQWMMKMCLKPYCP